MKILTYSETTRESLLTMLGRPEYSYYFVHKAFRPLLEELGEVVLVRDPEQEVDAIYRDCLRRGERCVFFSFSPPHRTHVELACPVVPVFAWEFDRIPDETWHDEPRNDWRWTLRRTPGAITHSLFSVKAVRASMGESYEVHSIPAPVWDRFAAHRARASLEPVSPGVELTVRGLVLDSRTVDLRAYDQTRHRVGDPRPLARSEQPVTLRLDGVLYGSSFTPHDGRKNWQDMVIAFCTAFRDTADATLVLKLTHFCLGGAAEAILTELHELAPFRCRVVIVDGFLEDADYARLMASLTYVVNTSHGEGQCLPLMEAMSSGKPAIAPRHSAMEEYITSENSFVVRSSPELWFWPHDVRHAFRTMRHRIDWESLVSAFQESHRVATSDPSRYARMSREAIRSLEDFCSDATVRAKLAGFFDRAVPAAGAHPGPIPVRPEEPRRPGLPDARPDRSDEADGVDARSVGFADARLSGWFEPAGELYRGVHVTPADLVVDIGSGEGGIASYCAGLGASTVVVDTSLAPVKEVRQRLSSSGTSRVHALVATGERLPLADSVATRVICTEVLEHVDDPERVMAELVRIGRPQSLYLLSVPHAAAEGLMKPFAPAMFEKPNHIRIFGHDDFANLVRSSGLEIVSHTRFGFYWALWFLFRFAVVTAVNRGSGNQLIDVSQPLLDQWTRTWHILMNSHRGPAVKEALDQVIPKSQVIVARK